MSTQDATPRQSASEILALADKAGLWYPMGNGADAMHTRARLFEFARMVADAERERCAKLCDAKAFHCDDADNYYGANAARDLADTIRGNP